MGRLFLIVWLLVVTAGLEASVKKGDCRYYLSICAIFRDEAPFLKEWIEFHRLVGVEHFILYNNGSVDHYQKVLAPYIKKGIVELIDWPSTPEEYIDEQRRAYNDCLTKSVGVSFWLAPLDIDEFLLPVDRPDLISYLKRYDEEEYVGAIQVNWQLYGTSFLPSIPKGKLLVESLVWKAPWDYNAKPRPNNTIFKSIVRPHAIAHYRIHEGDFKPKYYALPRNKFRKFQQPVQIEHLRINHYWTRAEDFFYDVKINRRTMSRDPSYVEVMMQKLLDLNQVYDPIMSKFVPQLSQRMKQR